VLDPRETLLTVVDVQERLVPHIHGNEELVRSIRKLILGCGILGVPVVATEQYVKGLGPTVEPIRAALGRSVPMEKMSFSCMQHDAFRALLEPLERRSILLCGIEAHVCVHQTAMDMKDAGYDVQIVGDAVSSRFPLNREIAFKRFQQEGIRLTTVETAVFEMLKLCGTEPFREWLKVLKD